MTSQTQNVRAARIALIALLSGALGIAFAPIFVRLSELGPTATAFYRLAFALPLLFLWMQIEGRRDAAPRRPSALGDYGRLILAGLCFAADLAVWHWSILFTSVANSTLFANFAPIFVTLGGWLIFGERFSLTFLGGMATALTGAIVLMGEHLTLSGRALAGDALAIAAAVFYAGYILAVKRLRAEFSAVTIMTWSGAVTCLALLPVALLSGESLIAQSAYGWAILIGLAWLSHAGGQSLIAHALADLPAAFSSVSLLLQPAAAAVLAWIILAEPLSLWQGLGGVLVLAGIIIARRGSR